MAGTSPPRRSSRARITQSQSQQSSTSSSLSGRLERNTRSFNKTGSPQKSTPSGSLSDEPPDESTDDTLNKRRRTRGQEEEERERAQSKMDTVKMTTEADDIQEDDEAVRCICGFEDYPGPPPPDEETKHSPKDTIDTKLPFPPDINDDIAGLFVQCDICKVWQHGACVGIMSDDAVTEEYFCELCRKDLHKICKASNGQQYSHYLPLSRESRTTSRAGSSSKGGTRSRSPRSKEGRETRNGRQSSVNQTSKRRSTMNSRDAAYDEDEQLRRAIEASKEDTVPEAGDIGTRRTKRGRSDSEEKLESAKRQRTSSRSTSPSDNKADLEDREDSEEPSNARNAAKKAKGTTTRQKDQKDKAEREERDRQRAEAANKRKGRAERRRADGSTPASTILVGGSEAHLDTDSDPSEELPLAAARAVNIRTAAIEKAATVAVVETKVESAPLPEAPPSSQPSPDTPSVGPVTQATSKAKRSHVKKGKGRNQYTKDRELHDEASPVRSQSRDVPGHEHGPLVHSKVGESSSKPHPRSKGGFNSKVSMTDMKRKAAAMFDFISRTQLELAGETTPPSQDSRRGSDNNVPQIAVNGNTPAEKKPSDVTNGEPNVITNQTDAPKDFKELNCVEMMDNLTRDLVKWQKEFLA